MASKMSNPIGILDYGCGNLKSLRNAVEEVGSKASLISSPLDLNNFNKIILPGVGAFDHAMDLLIANGFVEPLKSWASQIENKLLGICLGMQLLCELSQESRENMCGLGLIKENVQLLKSHKDVRLPHMGWSEVTFKTEDFKSNSGDYYFVHSYGVYCEDKEMELAVAEYGGRNFSCSITNGSNIMGHQFHPEKSHKLGLSLLKNWCSS